MRVCVSVGQKYKSLKNPGGYLPPRVGPSPLPGNKHETRFGMMTGPIYKGCLLSFVAMRYSLGCWLVAQTIGQDTGPSHLSEPYSRIGLSGHLGNWGP